MDRQHTNDRGVTKHQFRKRGDARRVARKTGQKEYLCKQCGWYHIGHRTQR